MLLWVALPTDKRKQMPYIPPLKNDLCLIPHTWPSSEYLSTTPRKNCKKREVFLYFIKLL